MNLLRAFGTHDLLEVFQIRTARKLRTPEVLASDAIRAVPSGSGDRHMTFCLEVLFSDDLFED